MKEELSLIENIELWACMCDMQLAYTCGVHDLFSKLRNVIVDTAINSDSRIMDLVEEVAHLTETLDGIKYTIERAMDFY